MKFKVKSAIFALFVSTVSASVNASIHQDIELYYDNPVVLKNGYTKMEWNISDEYTCFSSPEANVELNRSGDVYIKRTSL